MSVTVIAGLHVGRAWRGHEIEDDCPCGKAPCGLVDSALISPLCEQHAPGKTIRQGHSAADCPCAHTGEEHTS